MKVTSKAQLLTSSEAFIVRRLYTGEGMIEYSKIPYSGPEKPIQTGFIRIGNTVYPHNSPKILFCALDQCYKEIPRPELVVNVEGGKSILDPDRFYVWVESNGRLSMSKNKPNLDRYRPVRVSRDYCVMLHENLGTVSDSLVTQFRRLPERSRPPHKALSAKLHHGNPNMGKLTRHLKSIMKHHFFGVEFETSISAMPAIEQELLPIYRLHDGSLPLGGAEYATDILYGVGGLNAVKDICKKLQLFTKIDTSCSLHVHFGNIPNDRESLLALFILYGRLQEEILEILPRYVSKPIEIGGKSKSYADRLLTLGIGHTFGKNIYDPNDRKELISKWFSKMFQYYLGKPLSKEWNRKAKETPWKERTWRSATRYVQLQMADILVNPAKTIEFRVHHPSRNPDIVINWILICASIINYANRHTGNIIASAQSREKITLIDVLEDQGTSNPVVRHLINYINVLRNLRIEENLTALNFGTNQSSITAVHKFLKEKAEAELSADALPDGVNAIFDEIQSKKEQQRAIRLQI